MMLSATYIGAGMMVISAILHAAVGLLMKQASDRLAFRTALHLVTAIICLPFLFFVPLPEPRAWVFLVTGMALHFGYQMSQISAFNRGDMSLVYPVMRGLAPCLAGLFAFIFLRETLSLQSQIGLLISALAIIGFGWPKTLKATAAGPAFFYAVLCAVFVALYTVNDGAGMRITDNRWSYLVWFFVLDTFGTTIALYVRRKGRFVAALQSAGWPGIWAGLGSVVGFSLALFALSLAPIAKMSAMRETSVVFGALLAWWVLKEPLGARRIALAAVLVSGLILMQTG